MPLAQLPVAQRRPLLAWHGAPSRGRAMAANRVSLAAILAVIVGATNPFTIRLVGLMPISEIVLLAASTVVLLRMVLSHQVQDPEVYTPAFKILMACQAVALFGYVISDFWRGSTPSDIARGWARMVFLAFDVVCMTVLFKNLRVFVCYQIGVVISGMHVFVHGALFDDPWKFGYGVPLTILGLLTLPLGGPWLAALGVLGMAAVHWAMDFRSMALICVLLAGMQFLAAMSRQARLVLFPLALAAALVLVMFKGQIGGEGSERSKRSNAERTAMLSAAGEGFFQSPLIGQGSWFSKSNVMYRFIEIRAENAKEYGVGGFGDDDAETMAIHSQILVGLAEGGLLGGCFFAAYGLFLTWALYYLALVRPWGKETPVMFFVVLSGGLNLLFTPFSGAARVDIASTVALLLLLRREWPASAPSEKGVPWPRR